MGAGCEFETDSNHDGGEPLTISNHIPMEKANGGREARGIESSNGSSIRIDESQPSRPPFAPVATSVAMILSLGATVLPSRQAARLDPIEALKYE